jgi:hypothetical protein
MHYINYQIVKIKILKNHPHLPLYLATIAKALQLINFLLFILK